MASDEIVAAPEDSECLLVQRIDGELDAAIVFAASGIEANQNGNAEFCNTVLSDAQECYKNALAGLSSGNLTGEQRRHLDTKVNHLWRLLKQLRLARNSKITEAA